MNEATTNAPATTTAAAPAAPRKSVENTQTAIVNALRTALASAPTAEAKATVAGVAESVLGGIVSNDPKFPLTLARQALGL